MANDGTVMIGTDIDESGFKSGLSKLGWVAKTALAGVTAATTAASAAVGVLVKNSLNAYGDYEQLIGGVETLFNESARVVEEYTNNAYKTAGLSANQYMETVTGFSASLLQSLGGDTAAADIADQASIDMADNANKMGTSMGSIQNAYQGFAKQNYPMLDNLKLGYGGAKEEMDVCWQTLNRFPESILTSPFTLSGRGNSRTTACDCRCCCTDYHNIG